MNYRVNTIVDYVPYDVWIAAPRTRLLRTLKHFDWVTFDDLCIAADVPEMQDDARTRVAHMQMLLALIAEGVVLKRKLSKQRTQFRLAEGVSVEYPHDTAAIEPARDRRRANEIDPATGRRHYESGAAHGKIYTYKVIGCRCDECRAVNASYARDQRKRRAA